MRHAAVVAAWVAIFGPAIWLVMVLTRECGATLELWGAPLVGILAALGYSIHAAHRGGRWTALRIILAFLGALALLWTMRRVCSDRWWQDAGPIPRWFRRM